MGLPESRRLRHRLECNQFIWEEVLGRAGEGANHDETGREAKVKKSLCRVLEDPTPTNTS